MLASPCHAVCCVLHTSVQSGDVTVLMAVPTMYSYLLSHYDTHLSAQEQAAARRAAAGLRLTVSGSAAAPVPLLHRWQQLSGQMLLERYGMTETGMILSNPYKVCAWTAEGSVSGPAQHGARDHQEPVCRTWLVHDAWKAAVLGTDSSASGAFCCLGLSV
jgi:acyl-CoA synthetase (AMP-forming)/AMP-acid ligase II